ncbi:hypothetical protein NESM_000318000 [Novymonas esmeraldas]|uniref:Uncharacterized protein n=1 Tax=Novymonas esmeraldas TaxID=1808958 RepID=A0AAW0EIR6_9TRYP
MLVRSALRLWTPRYFRGRGVAGRPVGKRRVRTVDAPLAVGSSTPATLGVRQQTRAAAPPMSVPVPRRDRGRTGAPATPAPHDVASPATEPPIVRRAKDLLQQLSFATATPPSASPDAARAYVEFSAKSDVLGPLRNLLPAPHNTPRGGCTEALAPRQRFRVVAPEAAAGAPRSTEGGSPPGASTAVAFSLSDLVVLLQLYESVGAEDGQVLAQMMSEVHRQLLSAAATARVTASYTAEGNGDNSSGGGDVGPETPVMDASPALPLPALLYTMSSLGIVEEAILDIVASAAPLEGGQRRRGLLYAQLRAFSAVELLQLLVAFHRFGHSQQLSTKVVMAALRASMYRRETSVGLFHHAARRFKKAMAAPTQHTQDTRSDRAAVEPSVKSAAAVVAADPQLCALAFGLECPLYLLLEALTATVLTVHRRADVVAFLSDLIAVTAVVELTTAVAAGSAPGAVSAAQPIGREAHEFVLAVSHQLLRAAKLTESMELPQPLLSEVFAWSTTLSGRGVVVDGGEDSAIPSDRVVYYDHVTADLVKMGRVD